MAIRPYQKNPADVATRPILASSLETSHWLTGPEHLLQKTQPDREETFSLEDPDSDKEVKPEVTSMRTFITEGLEQQLGSHRFERFSTWRNLINSIIKLKALAWKFKKDQTLESKNPECIERCTQAEELVIRTVQREVYWKELDRIQALKPLQRDSCLLALDPVVDEGGLLRVGGRLSKVETPHCYPPCAPSPRHGETSRTAFHRRSCQDSRLLDNWWEKAYLFHITQMCALPKTGGKTGTSKDG